MKIVLSTAASVALMAATVSGAFADDHIGPPTPGTPDCDGQFIAFVAQLGKHLPCFWDAAQKQWPLTGQISLPSPYGRRADRAVSRSAAGFLRLCRSHRPERLQHAVLLGRRL